MLKEEAKYDKDLVILQLSTYSLKEFKKILDWWIEKEDINYQYPQNGVSLLMAASRRGTNLTKLKLLVRKGAEINIQDNLLQTSLHRIILLNCRRDNVEFLIRSGADLSVCDRRGESVLFDAQGSSNLDLLKDKLQECPELLYPNYKNETPYTSFLWTDVGLHKGFLEGIDLNIVPGFHNFNSFGIGGIC